MSGALEMISKACEMSKGGEVFILKMKTMKITEVADVMIRVLAPAYGFNPDAIRTELIGVKPGEKLREELMTESEQQRAYEAENLFIIVPEMTKLSHVQEYYRDLAAQGDIKPYLPKEPVFVSAREIEEIIHLLNYG
jgi:FlaA1/EpsC-like NDP-sugar epimerase